MRGVLIIRSINESKSGSDRDCVLEEIVKFRADDRLISGFLDDATPRGSEGIRGDKYM